MRATGYTSATGSASAAGGSQEKIWSHFQNADPESFAAAKPRLEYLVRVIASRVKAKRPTVLNIGVGSGLFEQLALARGWEVHALDPDAVTIERLAGSGVIGHVGYIEQMEIESNQFDAVVASEVLEHLRDEQRAAGLAEIAPVLKPGGWFLCTVPYNENLNQRRRLPLLRHPLSPLRPSSVVHAGALARRARTKV